MGKIHGGYHEPLNCSKPTINGRRVNNTNKRQITYKKGNMTLFITRVAETHIKEEKIVPIDSHIEYTPSIINSTGWRF